MESTQLLFSGQKFPLGILRFHVLHEVVAQLVAPPLEAAIPVWEIADDLVVDALVNPVFVSRLTQQIAIVLLTQPSQLSLDVLR
jgi:hypothetical protein